MADAQNTEQSNLFQDNRESIARPEHLRPSLAIGLSGYSNGCRCANCSAANTENTRMRRALARASRSPKPDKQYVVAVDLDLALPRLSLEYMAGFFDGEGCINITGGTKKRCRGYRTYLRVMITNTDKDVLDLIHWNFGGRLAKPRREGWEGGNWKANRALNFSSGEAVAFLKKIRPYLCIKTKQADLAFEYWEYTHRSHEERYEQVLSTDPVSGMNGGRYVTTQRKLEVIEKELWFKGQMHILNKKGIR